jgi:hypothetical protein
LITNIQYSADAVYSILWLVFVLLDEQ